MGEEEKQSEVPDISRLLTPGTEQQSPTQSGTSVVPSTERSSTILGKDLAVDLSGMSRAAGDDIPFSPVAIAGINAALYAFRTRAEAAEVSSTNARQRNDDLRDRLGTAVTNEAVRTVERDTAIDGSNFRQVINTIGAVLLGYSPSLAEKAGGTTGVVLGILGAALVFAAWMYKSKARRSS